MIKYRQILLLKISHEYFSGGSGQYLTLAPSLASGRWLQQEAILFRYVAPTGHLLLSDAVNLADLARQNPGLTLEFEIRSQDPGFFNYTDMPLDQVGRLVFSIPDAGNGDSSSVKLSSTFVPSDAADGVVAVVRIDLEALAAYSGAPQMDVHFQNRAIRWKYFIINQTENKFDQLQLQGKDKDLFLDVQPAQLPTGGAAWLFDSGANRIPLKNDGNIELSLVGIMGNGGSAVSTELINRLPNAAPDHLQVDNDEAEADYYSAIYVYL